MSAGFPNLFAITGPQSPSVLTNMPVAIEQHVEWISGLIGHMRDTGPEVVEPTRDAEEEWVKHTQEVAHATLFPESATWYMGANIPGKPQVFLPLPRRPRTLPPEVRRGRGERVRRVRLRQPGRDQSLTESPPCSRAFRAVGRADRQTRAECSAHNRKPRAGPRALRRADEQGD